MKSNKVVLSAKNISITFGALKAVTDFNLEIKENELVGVVLSAKNISITFGALKAVTDFNLEIKENELVGLIGPNGAGKTTVFNMWF